MGFLWRQAPDFGIQSVHALLHGGKLRQNYWDSCLSADRTSTFIDEIMRKIELNENYTLFLSPDIKESEEYIVALWRKWLNKCQIFDIFTPVYLDGKGEIFYHGGGITPFEHLPYPEAQAQLLRNQYPKPRVVDFSPLWVFVISNKVLKDLGDPPEMDKNIYTHADYVVRARKRGYQVKVCPDIRLTYTQVYTINEEKVEWINKLKKSRKQFKINHSVWLNKQYRLPCVFHTHTGYPGGYCLHARSLIKKLAEKKIRIHYKFIGGCNDDEPLADDFLVDDLRENMGSMRLPQIVLSTGLNCFSNSGDYKIGFTTTEVDGIPKDWVRVLNEMDEVWTTSEFAKAGFISSGVKPPVINMLEGVDPEYFHPDIVPFENNVKKKFLFIANFAWGRRKGINELFEAFSKEFSYKEDVALVIKALPSYHGMDIKKDIQQLYHRGDSAPILVWDTVLPNYLLGGFYTAGHCLLVPTRGEGFGLPPLEALACGIPVITTGYSGHMDYLKKDGKPLPGVELINYKIAKFDGSDSIYYHGFNWALPSISHLRQLMRKVYTDYDKYKSDAMETSKYIRRAWSWDAISDLVIKRLQDIHEGKGIKPLNKK